MYRPGKLVHGPPPFGPPPPHGPSFRLGGPCSVPPPGHLPQGPCGPFSLSAQDDHFNHKRQPRGHFIRPQCSSFSIDSTMIALGGRHQISLPAEPVHSQVPQWNPTPVKHHPPDNRYIEQAGEEFLRCIAANKPLPDYLKGNMAYSLVDAFKSANVLKEAVKTDHFQKHVTRSKSRSHGRSLGKTWGKSQAKSHERSKSCLRSQSRGRSKSCARGKSRVRSKSGERGKCRARSWSRSQSRSKKSRAWSKSRVMRSKSRSSSDEKSHARDKKMKRSPSHICSSVGSSHNLTGNSLLEGLKLVMNSKILEERLPTLKEAILTIQASDESKKVQCVADEHRHQQHNSQENSKTLENDSMLLPHDRVGSDFSWLRAQSQEDSTVWKADEPEDEEMFLYGNEDTGAKQVSKSSTALFSAFSQIGEHAKLQEMGNFALGSQQHHQNKSILRSTGDVLDLKQPLQMTSSSVASANLDSIECEKIKNILKGLGTADISEIMVKIQEQKEEKQLSLAFPATDPKAAGLALPALSDPNVQQDLESLQSLIKVTKEERAKRDGSGTSQTSSDKHKAGDDKEREREKQARMSKMESLMKELDGLLKQDGLSFLAPVIGFYCQKCEEFIGDLNSAENHAAIHHHSNSTSKMQMDKHSEDSKVQLCYFSHSSNQHPPPSDRRDHIAYSYYRGSGDHRNHRDYQRDWRGEIEHRNKHNDNHRNYRTRQEDLVLKEEMRNERMLITVSHGLTPLPHMRVKEEVNKELQATGSHSKVKVKDTDNKGISSKEGREKNDKVKDESSDGDDDKGKTPKPKSPKKKKKEKKKKKKEKRDKS